MGKVSSKVRKFRARAGRGAIMKPSTFARIARTSKGGTKAAGAAYWRAAKAKAKRGSTRDLKRSRRRR
jgi:hypothetical protein